MVGTVSEIEEVKTVTAYVNTYHRQNVKELPNSWEVIVPLDLELKPSVNCLGCIWFADDWNGNRDSLYVDSDPEWISFIDHLADLVEEQGVQQVMFYYP